MFVKKYNPIIRLKIIIKYKNKKKKLNTIKF